LLYEAYGKLQDELMYTSVLEAGLALFTFSLHPLAKPFLSFHMEDLVRRGD
jgi:hypothetical protein